MRYPECRICFVYLNSVKKSPKYSLHVCTVTLCIFYPSRCTPQTNIYCVFQFFQFRNNQNIDNLMCMLFPSRGTQHIEYLLCISILSS